LGRTRSARGLFRIVVVAAERGHQRDGMVAPNPFRLAWANDARVCNGASDQRALLWRELRKVFEVLSVNTAHRTDQDAERVAIVCQLKFLKELNGARLTVRVVTGLPGRPSARQIVYQEQISGPKDFAKSLVLGSLPITRPGAPFARHAVWGPQLPGQDIAPGQVTMIPGARSIIELSVGPQSYRLYAQALDPTREDSTRLYLLCEDEFPWPAG
jgi:hypothetical protein